MAETFLLEIISPSRKLLSEEVELVTAPGELGEFGVLAGHTFFFSLLKAGTVMYRRGGSEERIVVSRGYADVGPEKTLLLVDDAVREAEIDAAGAREELRAAEEKLASLEEGDPAYEATLGEVEFANAKLRLKEGV